MPPTAPAPDSPAVPVVEPATPADFDRIRELTVGVYRDEDSALAKHWVCAHLRETVALAREVCGGNGIRLETGVMRHFADAEAIYTYEGTNEISALMVGRAATGVSAFV